MCNDTMSKIEASINTATPSLKAFIESINRAAEVFIDTQTGLGYHTTVNKRGKVRIWWLPYGTYVPCHVCQTKIIPVEEVWCGCKPVPRKMKKWCKGRRAVYKETMG